MTFWDGFAFEIGRTAAGGVIVAVVLVLVAVIAGMVFGGSILADRMRRGK